MNADEVVLVNEQDQEIGVMNKMEAHKKGLLHRAISVFVFNSEKQWLLQQRAEHKYHSGLLWSNTSCTHPMAGEEELDAANRRLREEMGMEAPLKKLFNFQYKAELDNDLIENELDHIFVGYTNQKPQVNPDEVCAYKYISTEDLKKELETNPEQFSAWFRLLFEKLHAEMDL
ncbi:MAG: isopentenyl-diphosphate Delta-isomerase [Flavobacteriales bacterium]